MLKDLFSKLRKNKNNSVDIQVDDDIVKIENTTSSFDNQIDCSVENMEIVDNPYDKVEVVQENNIVDNIEKDGFVQDEPLILDAVIEDSELSDNLLSDKDNYTVVIDNKASIGEVGNAIEDIDIDKNQMNTDESKECSSGVEFVQNVDYKDSDTDTHTIDEDNIAQNENYKDDDFDYDYDQEDEFYDKKIKKSKKKLDNEKVNEKKEDESQNVTIKIKTIAMKSEESKINAFDLFFIKLWVMVLGAISLIADGINYIIFKIFNKKAPKRYVRAFVSILFILLIELCIILPIALT